MKPSERFNLEDWYSRADDDRPDAAQWAIAIAIYQLHLAVDRIQDMLAHPEEEGATIKVQPVQERT